MIFFLLAADSLGESRPLACCARARPDVAMLFLVEFALANVESAWVLGAWTRAFDRSCCMFRRLGASGAQGADPSSMQIQPEMIHLHSGMCGNERSLTPSKKTHGPKEMSLRLLGSKIQHTASLPNWYSE
jgi:hypothetical protein